MDVVAGVGGQRAGRCAEGGRAEREPNLIHRHAGPRCVEKQRDLQVIFQMLADVRRIDLARNAEGRKLLSRSDSRQKQQLRRSDGSAAEHNFLGRQRRALLPVGRAVIDADRAFVARRTIEHDAAGAGPRDDREIGPLFGLAFQEGVVRAGPFAVFCRGLEERDDAGRTPAIASVVVTARNAGRHGGVHKFTGTGQNWRAHRDPERTGRVVRTVVDGDLVAGREAFALLEIGENLAVTPAGGAPLAQASKSPGWPRT